MPFFASVGASQLSIGTGGFSPGVGPQDTAASAAAGSLGTSTITSNTAASSVSGQRVTFNPLGGGGISYSISSGSLPTGFSLNSSTGAVSGSYTVQGRNTPGQVFTFTVRATSQLNVASTSDRTYTISLSVPFKYKQIVSTSYMVGGYQNSVLWNNCNRTVHSTDTTTNLGDGRIQNFHYKSGVCSTTKVFIWNGGFVTAFNMRTESISNSGSINFSGSNTGSIQDSDFIYGWINGEGCNQVRRWTIATENVTADRGNGWSDHAASIFGETRGIWWGNSGQTARFIYSSESYANMGYSAGAHGQQKGLSSKDGKGYGGAQGSYNGGNQFRVTNIESESNITTVGKPFGNMGEENFVHGQEKGYCIGTYDGAQNNRAFVLTYATNSGFETGSTTQPKGKGGCSSGHCGFRD
jgi:hypothetical protein